MNPLENIRSSIVEAGHLKPGAPGRITGRMVFTNGCFDILHQGHIQYLAQAAGLGDFLVIGLNSDPSVQRLKGKNRPVQDQHTRALILASLRFVDFVVIFEEDTPDILIKTLMPDVLVKGGDYKPEDIVGFDTVTGNGGKVLCLDFLPGHSSTRIIEKLKD